MKGRIAVVRGLLLIVVVHGMQLSPSVSGETNVPPSGVVSGEMDKAPSQTTIFISGSVITQNRWRTTHMQVRKGARISVAVSPLETLNKSPEYRHDALVFRVGRTGKEHLTDSNGRANALDWEGPDKKQKVWMSTPTHSFIADLDGDLFYATRQNGKFCAKIEVEP